MSNSSSDFRMESFLCAARLLGFQNAITFKNPSKVKDSDNDTGLNQVVVTQVNRSEAELSAFALFRVCLSSAR